MIQVAILTGGPSAERGIALNSAKLVGTHLNEAKYSFRTIIVEEDGWFDQDSGSQVDLNDFSLSIGGMKLMFDFAFLIIHGTPVEDGKLQGYFEMRGTPHSTCNTLTSALAFNKQWCKDFLTTYNVPMAKSKVIMSDVIKDTDPNDFDYPVFVKPNKNGSSYGVSRVESGEGLLEALNKAAQFDTEVMVETYMAGREFSCGVVKEGEKLHVFPVTEIIPEGDFFDYNAKYMGASQEVTPADLNTEQSDQCRTRSAELYRLLDCDGMVRFDYILMNDVFHLLEVNTVPGLSEASIIPQQARAYGWTVEHLLDVVIQDAINPIWLHAGPMVY